MLFAEGLFIGAILGLIIYVLARLDMNPRGVSFELAGITALVSAGLYLLVSMIMLGGMS